MKQETTTLTLTITKQVIVPKSEVDTIWNNNPNWCDYLNAMETYLKKFLTDDEILKDYSF